MIWPWAGQPSSVLEVNFRRVVPWSSSREQRQRLRSRRVESIGRRPPLSRGCLGGPAVQRPSIIGRPSSMSCVAWREAFSQLARQLINEASHGVCDWSENRRPRPDSIEYRWLRRGGRHVPARMTLIIVRTRNITMSTIYPPSFREHWGCAEVLFARSRFASRGRGEGRRPSVLVSLRCPGRTGRWWVGCSLWSHLRFPSGRCRPRKPSRRRR